MAKLTTHSKVIQDGKVRVHWYAGRKNKGILDVMVEQGSDDQDVSAELIAIKFLLFVKQVFGYQPYSGVGHELFVSKGAIRKLSLGKSKKSHLLRQVHFLTNRLRGIQITISKDASVLQATTECKVTRLDLDPEFAEKSYNEVDTPAMGRIRVSNHALDQYVKRIESGVPKDPWRSLEARIRNPDLKPYMIPERALRAKAKKYGASDNIEAWKHPTCDLVYLLVVEGTQKTLKTVFSVSWMRN